MATKLNFDWSKIKDKIKEAETKTTGFSKDKKEDTRFFQPTLNKEGKAELVVRLLPSPDTDVPYVKKYSHYFKGRNGWFISDCPKTIGEACPVCEDVRRFYKEGDKTTGGKRNAKLNVICNILIIKDPNNPENEGKVFLYRYGKKLHEKFIDKIQPADGSIDDPVMIFDPIEGCDFKLKIRPVKYKDAEGQEKTSNNYDSSEFGAVRAMTDAQIKAMEEGLYNLSEFVDKKDFKSYEQLKSLYEKKTGDVQTERKETAIPEKDQVDDSAVDAEPALDLDNADSDSFFNDLENGK